MLRKVRQRGLPGLLELKSVALTVGTNLSLIYSHHFEGGKSMSGDSRDILHAIVTNDRRLETILARIPACEFQVMNLRSFLNWLPGWV
jgi:hypothetical protein